MTGFFAVGSFLVNIVFNLGIFLLWLHIFLRYYKVSSLHPISQSIFNFTNPIINPIERAVFHNKPRPPRYDWVALGLIIVLELIKFLLLGLIIYHITLPLSYLLLFTLADLIIQPCDLLFYALLIRVIMSWVNPQWASHPASGLINRLTDPLLLMGRRIIPVTSGFDFAPLIMIVILKIITLFISASLPLRLL